MTVALHERGQFTWAEWAGRLGGAIAAAGADAGADTGNDPEAYWRCWLTALEETIGAAGIAGPDVLEGLRAAWREAAAATPHGEPITLSRKVSGDFGKPIS